MPANITTTAVKHNPVSHPFVNSLSFEITKMMMAVPELTRRRCTRIGHIDIQTDINRSIPYPRFNLVGDPL